MQNNVSPAGWHGVLACSPSPVERGLFMLDAPGLKKAAGLGMRMSIDHCCL